ncbi:ribosomal protein S10 [Phlegmacium glaucopus]|nr:ribosomal protein S10 [Phlegmacium glaucopus]
MTRSAEAEFPEPSLPELAETEDLQKSQADFKSLGLKYDPSTLPLQRELTPRDNPSEEEYAMTLVHGRSVFPPHLHPRTHGIPVANVHFRSHHIPLLKLFTHFALHAASSLGIPASNVIFLPTQRSLWTVIRSPFAHKKSQENFERRVHKRAIKAWDADPEVVQRWIAYLRKNAMPGVGMKITIWDRVPLGMGASDLDGLDTMENLMVEAPSNIKTLGHQIVAEEVSKQPSV